MVSWSMMVSRAIGGGGMIEVLDPLVCRLCVCSGELSTVPYEEKDQGIYCLRRGREGEKRKCWGERKARAAEPTQVQRDEKDLVVNERSFLL